MKSMKVETESSRRLGAAFLAAKGRGSARAAWCALALAAAFFLAPSPEARAQGRGGGAAKGAAKAPREAPLPASVVEREGLSVLLGRPTDRSIVCNLLANEDLEAYVEYGFDVGAYSKKSGALQLTANRNAEVLIDDLAPDREYFYRVQSRAPSSGAYSPGPEGRFRTQRAPGAEFSFEIIGDSHPERPQQFDASLYAQNLAHAAKDGPDFFLTIGDDFSVDTLASIDEGSVNGVYRRQRLYLSLVGSSAPVFLVNGNHEQASLANLDGTAENVAVWAQNARNANFPQPAPDRFYTGDEEQVEHIGPLRDYYAWTWGDALFVVIDPYWHSPEPVDNVLGGGAKTRDLWKVTLGDAQYAWLKKTFEGSKSTFKFVFSHHVSGTGRGGVERAPYFEWGGRSADGKSGFAAARPGWAAPIHELLVRNNVTAFVQGHDHVFANQLLDGVAYITLPEPADPSYALYNADAFKVGDLLPNSGRVRFTVGAGRVVVEYLREWLPGDLPAGLSASEPAYRLEIPAGGRPSPGVFGEGQAATKRASPSPAEEPAAKGGAAAGSKQPKVAKRPKEGTKAKDAEAPSAAAIAPSGDLHARTLVEYPGKGSVGLSTAFLKDVDYFYRYGDDPGRLDRTTPLRSAAAGSVALDRIEGLEPGRVYHFQLEFADRGSKDFTLSEPGRFSTRKAPGQSFTFAIEADPHLDENSSGDVYRSALARMAGDSPDFIVDLGDTSMVEKLARDAQGYLARDRLVRSYWDDIGAQVPFCMVLGNHDGEHGWGVSKGQPTSEEAAALRKEWLLDPRRASADGYDVFSDLAYSFEWGDALFVILDPYLAEKSKPAEDGWAWTLGKPQYDWLSGVLARSKAAYRFVFIHNMLGGTGKDARGGADWAEYYEWGGRSADGKADFGEKRPGWAMPLRDLFATNGVDVVFRGHDHFYAREEKDGIVYQLAPQPSTAKERSLDQGELADYGYSSGTFLPSPGYLRVSVSSERALVEYVLAGSGEIAHSYSISP